jgi:hypothetical protein
MKMRSTNTIIQPGRLLIILLAYCAASLFHFAHNAVYIDDYPNLPAWITATGTYVAWCGITAIGVAGYLLLRRGYRLVGLAVIAVYGTFGLDGLAHYSLAPISAHTFTMNLSIWLEAITAVIVLIVVTGMMAGHARSRSAAIQD